MILPGVRKVKLDSIVVEKGFSQRKKTAHHESRKASIKRHGLINLIVIQDRTRKLLAGGDRLAALQALKVKAHEVRVFRGTEEEFEALQLAENIERRHNDDVDALTKRYVELTRGEIEKADEEVAEIEAAARIEASLRETFPDAPPMLPTEPPRSVGRPKTSQGKAREAVAAATGKTPEAIRQAEKRATAKERKAAEPAAPPVDPTAPLPPPVETYGLPLLSDDEAYQVVVAQEALRALEAKLYKAETFLVGQVGADSLAAVLCGHVTAALATMAAAARAAYPRAVCPHCKRLPARTEKCDACSGTGFVGVTAWLNAPDELRLGGDLARVSDGKGGTVPYAREATKAEKVSTSKPAKGARRLRIEMEDGSEYQGGE